MSVSKLFESIEQARDVANWKSAFGEPQVVDDRTIIPVAQVSYGFGLGFGSGGPAPEDEDASGAGGEGAGGGGGVTAKPCGAIVVTPDNVYFEDTRDDNKVAMAGILFSAFLTYQIAKTLRVLLGRK